MFIRGLVTHMLISDIRKHTVRTQTYIIHAVVAVFSMDTVHTSQPVDHLCM